MSELSFLEKDLTKIRNEMKQDFEAAYGKTLYEGSSEALFIDWLAYWIWHANCSANEFARQNLPMYATGENLDALLVGMFGIERSDVKAAKTELTFYGELGSEIEVPAGTLVTHDGEVYFETQTTVKTSDGIEFVTDDEGFEHFIDSNFATVEAVCTTLGVKGNGIEKGTEFKCEIAEITKVINVAETYGGAERETDEEYYRRYLEESQGWSSAGSYNLYEYLAKQCEGVLDVWATEIEEDSQYYGAGYNVLLWIITKTPAQATAVLKYINESPRKAQGDKVLVSQADPKLYTIEGKYSIAKSDIRSDEEIEKAIADAVARFRDYTENKLGRTLNPTKLVTLLKEAGAEFVQITQPSEAETLEKSWRWELSGDVKLVRGADIDE